MPGTGTSIYIQGIECTYFMPDGRFALAESCDLDGPKITLPIKCAWEDRWHLVKALLPTCQVDGSADGFTRTKPYALPSSLGPVGLNQALYATSVGAFQYLGSGVDGGGQMAGRYAVLPTTFSCVPWQFDDGDPAGQNDASGQAWTITRIKPSAEVYQPTGGSYWVAPFPSTTPLDEASIGFLRANVEISVTRKMLPYVVLDDLVKGDTTPALGSVNATAMTFADTTYDPGYLLLIASEASDPYFDCLGNPVVDQTFVYLGRLSATWNKVQDRSAAWQSINSKTDGTGKPPFPTYDFTTLPR